MYTQLYRKAFLQSKRELQVERLLEISLKNQQLLIPVFASS